MTLRKILFSITVTVSVLSISAQVENAGEVRKRAREEVSGNVPASGISDRMLRTLERRDAEDSNIDYMRRVYRELDLRKERNSSLYFPEEVVDGKENLFRILLNNVVAGKVPAYEYLDGKEIFSEQYRIDVADMLRRFDIYARPAKGSTDASPRYEIDESDVPVSQVLTYYIIEKWEFDRLSSHMKTKVEAICPVITRAGDFGGDNRYPMFWVRYGDLRPYLLETCVSVSDDNNLARHTIDDYFNMGLYDGEIYKTANMRNLSMAQMYPDEDDRRRAQDSIDHRLRSYGKHLWVPTREEFLKMKEREEQMKEGLSDSIPERTVVMDSSVAAEKTSASSRAKKRTSQKKKTSVTEKGGSSRAAVKSVRRRKR